MLRNYCGKALQQSREQGRDGRQREEQQACWPWPWGDSLAEQPQEVAGTLLSWPQTDLHLLFLLTLLLESTNLFWFFSSLSIWDWKLVLLGHCIIASYLLHGQRFDSYKSCWLVETVGQQLEWDSQSSHSWYMLLPCPIVQYLMQFHHLHG